MCVIVETTVSRVFIIIFTIFLFNLRGNLSSFADGIFCSGFDVFVANALLFIWRLLYHIFFLFGV